ncbi:MAG: HAMP domain-containing histidine kinase [Candidatus Lambdaproteobacteria bacterium]|nr:HAMP domain-containing histidine kinase [Candidatus Lambdaproteobacteria bacterium]
MSEITVLAVHGDERMQRELTALLGPDAVLCADTLAAGIAALSSHPLIDVLITGDDALGQALQEHCRRARRDVSRLVIDDGLCEEDKARLLGRDDIFLLIRAPLLRENTLLAVHRAREHVGLQRRLRATPLTVHDAAGERIPGEGGSPTLFGLAAGPLRRALEVDELMMVAAHEIRAPLSVMVGYAHLLKDMENGLATEATTLVERIQSTGDRLLDKVNSFLGLAKLESGDVPLNCAPTRISELLNAVVSDFVGLIESRRIQLSVHVDGDEQPYLLDRDKVESVIQNLLSNAIKFTDPGGSIRVDCAARPECIQCSVTDTGRGMDEAQVRAAFDKFTRPSDRAAEGSGLGLAIARSIVRLHGGNIWVDSRKGQGSTFTFTLLPQSSC